LVRFVKRHWRLRPGPTDFGSRPRVKEAQLLPNRLEKFRSLKSPEAHHAVDQRDLGAANACEIKLGLGHGTGALECDLIPSIASETPSEMFDPSY